MDGLRALLASTVLWILLAGSLPGEEPRVERDPGPETRPGSVRPPSPEGQGGRELRVPPSAPTRWGVSLIGRADFLSDNSAADDFADYDDLWGNGFGASLKLSYDLLDGTTIRLGPYAAVGFDTFDGESHTGTDATVGTVDVDVEDLTVWTGTLGVDVQTALSDSDCGFRLGAHVGGGFGHYSDVDADLLFITQGNARFDDEPFYDRSTTWSFEAGLRAGYQVKQWGFFVGGGVRAIGEPDDGGRLQPDARTLTFYSLEAGIEFRW